MSILVSALIPTRNGFIGLKKTVHSILDTSTDKSRVEIVVKIDDDDQDTLTKAKSLPQTVIVVSPRGTGYNEMGRFVYEAAIKATGKWAFLIDDDAWLEGKGWDDQLAKLEPKECCAQCEFYHLGNSKYPRGSCGPVGLFVPMELPQSIPQNGCLAAADVMLEGMTVGKGWPKHLLDGIAYCHDGRVR